MNQAHQIGAKEYPQFQPGSDIAAPGLTERFDRYAAVNNRPQKVLSFEKTARGLILTAAASAKKSVLCYTHETSMYQYKPAEPTIDQLYLHLEIQSPSIFRVKMSDEKFPADPFSGIPEEGRMLIGKPEDVPFEIIEDNNYILIRTSEMTVSVEKETTRITAAHADGREFFAQKKNSFFTADIFDMAIADLNGEKSAFEAIELEHDEIIYGLGERFDSIVRNGRAVDFHNKDAIGTTGRRTYMNIPFYMSTKGYGLFLNSGAPTNWEVATGEMSALYFSVEDNRMDYFVICGPSPKDILYRYCTLTGFAALPPLWSFGLWMSRNSYTSWEIVDDIARKVRQNDIPCDVLHLDTAWFKKDWDCDLEFSGERFPNPEQHMDKLRKDGFRISLWQYNFIPPNKGNTHYEEAVRNGYLAKHADGTPYQLPETCKGSWTTDVIVDFSNPQARAWYANKIRRLIKTGAGAIKTDFGEGIPETAHYHAIDGKHFHNTYSLLYNSVVFNATKDAGGDEIVWARSGTAGSQRYPLNWGGDSQCTFEALAGTLRGALSAGMSGIPFFSHDIGGFIGLPSDELYIRWAQMGLFSSHSRCHGAGDHTHREPWAFSETACEIFRFYDKLRYSLMPYIYSEAEKCTRTGLPMMRALFLEYPSDPNVRHIDDQYLFGDSLLIAPILKPLSKTNKRRIYLPKGIWHDYFTRERIESDGRWIEREVDLKTMPIYVKDGTVLRYCKCGNTLSDGMGEIVREEYWGEQP
ncbi:MAG: DUF4968 domain-containing protein [Clostridia bacterium]|nr:DUF4968 domain-containing protein [Clostridia bacterium]